MRSIVRPLVAVSLLAGLTAAPQAVAAPVEFSFAGRGFGHGVGMSQYGAYGAALAGWGEARIIRHYYPGTTLGRTTPAQRRVRVLLQERRLRTSMVATRAVLARPATGPALALPAGPLRVTREADRAVITDRMGRAHALAMPVRLISRAPLAVGGIRYRGAVEVHPESTRRVDVVNDVPLEGYLRGVVPREVPASWARRAAAAVRAQAIVARSYAVSSRRQGAHFELHADTRSQVYGGLDAEDPRAGAAVAATAGRVVQREGAVVTTYFFSTSGGRTESAAVVWGVPAVHLVSRPDPFDRVSPYHRWPEPVRIRGDALAEGLGLDAAVTDIRVLERARSPRVVRVRITTADGATATVSGARLQAAAGLRSTWFSVRRSRP